MSTRLRIACFVLILLSVAVGVPALFGPLLGAAAGIRVAEGITDNEVVFAGSLDLDNVPRDVVPARPARDGVHAGSAYLSEASGVMTQPQAGGSLVALWAARELAPWLLAAAVLGFVVAEVGTGGTSVGPLVSPELTLSPLHVLPGVFVLVLARVFKRRAELREFDRSAV